MMTIAQLKTALCTGCSACAQICPRDCISMEADPEGFLRPVIHTGQCVDCGLCAKSCPVLTPETPQHTPAAWAARAKDETIRSASSSGGIFTLLAERILEQGGVVFGAGFTADFEVAHMAVETKDALANLRGSKYVQSRTGDSFRQAKAYLDAGRMVLFSGTPCQIAGLRRFLGKPCSNLITQDIICHGVPSPSAWHQYLRQLEKKYRAPVSDVNFRHKEPGWRSNSIRIRFENGRICQRLRSRDPYMRSFLADLTLRPSCYACVFKQDARVSDFTLADFWGIQHCIPEMDDDRGISLVICHTERAEALLDSIRDRTVCEQADLRKAVSHNLAICQSAARPNQRDDFMRQIANAPYQKVADRYCKRLTLPERILRKAVRLLKG